MPHTRTTSHKANYDALREEMRDKGLTYEEITDEFSRRYGLRRREAFRRAYGWTLREAAGQFNVMATKTRTDTTGQATMTAARLCEYEKWPASGRQPSPYALTVLALMYGTEVHRLLDLDDHRALPPNVRLVLAKNGHRRPSVSPTAPVVLLTSELAPLSAPAAPAVPARTVTAVTERVSSQRLALLQGATPAVLDRAAEESAELAECAEETRLSDETLEELHEELVRLAAAYVHQPLDPVVVDLLRVRDQAGQLISRRQYPRQVADLYVILGRACALLAYAAGDLGQPDTALAHARAAWTFASCAGHRGLMAWIRGAQSSTAYWAGRPDQASRLAARASQQFAGVGGTLEVFLAALEARSLGRLGNKAGAREAIDRATAARDHASPDEIGGVFTFPTAKQALYASSAFIFISDAEAAEHAAVQAITLYEDGPVQDRSYGDEAGARLDLAAAYAHRGRLDGTLHAVAPVLELPPELQVAPTVRRLELLDHEVSQLYRNAPEARALTDQIRIYQAARLPTGFAATSK